jgi:two-component system sensor histidine kinase AtoS
VDAILTQVGLLRQIAAEFSSFASSPTARPVVTDTADLLREVIEPYRAGLAGRIDVDVRIAGDLPPVFVDRTLIGRALANIIENALHAMPGRGALSAAASVDPGSDQVAITVADTGVGMDAEALSRLFEPYFSTKASGTGLGLTIARRNIELNGGTIEISSVKGEGTTVTVRLQIYRSNETGN